jgi:pimeloyl-ACP methyl ester carboxylesterase
LKLATQSWGEVGRPLAVLVHGLTGSSRSWWRVGPWFAANGWHALGMDLRGHGASPRMQDVEELRDLAADVRETVTDLLGSEARVDVLLGHSLGALTAMKLCGDHPDFASRLVLEDPPSGGNDPDETAREVEQNAARAREDPLALSREMLSENPYWAEEDAENSVAGLRDCDAGALASFRRSGLRWDLAALVDSVRVPALLLLGDEDRGSALPGNERAAVASALRQGSIEELEAGHNVHRDDFEGYVRVLGAWLGEPRAN